MNYRKQVKDFWVVFIHPRVFVFMVVGTGIIFLTFLTSNDALEIAISGIASVFIGIGVNNFSSQEAYLRNRERRSFYLAHSMEIMEMERLKIRNLQSDLVDPNCAGIRNGLSEIDKLVSMNITLLRELDSL